MTLDDLKSQYEDAIETYCEFNDTITKLMTREHQDKRARLRAEISFREQTLWIARQWGMEAAMLFKLSDGNIDPRSPV